MELPVVKVQEEAKAFRCLVQTAVFREPPPTPSEQPPTPPASSEQQPSTTNHQPSLNSNQAPPTPDQPNIVV
ncbi:hypothetical protein L1887_22681 [Cichorium endivia]|nr:hypothetical protein L1887_22681 [Cichorium endivia]